LRERRAMNFPERKRQTGSSILLCKFGLHKWESYGDIVQVFWKEPSIVVGGRARGVLDSESKSKAVYSKRQCLRCGVKLKRKLLHNPDGTASAFGWEPDAEEIQQHGQKPARTQASYLDKFRLWAYVILAIGVVAFVSYFLAIQSGLVGGSLWIWIGAIVVFSMAYLLVRLVTRL